jgi:hypothetical protein
VCVAAWGAACASSFGEQLASSEADAGSAGESGAPPIAAADAALAPDPDAGRTIGGSTVTGEVVFVDAGTAPVTTVILAPGDFDAESFHETAPVGPRATGVTGSWTMRDVPAGTYVVLAGYEQDGLVLDPTTPPPRIAVTGASSETVIVPSAQKLVPALRIVTIRAKSSEPAVTFVDGAGEDAYAVSVIDWLGKPIYAATEAAASSNANVTFRVDAGLVVPLRYRFRVTAKKGDAAITQTEDLAAIRTAAPDDT